MRSLIFFLLLLTDCANYHNSQRQYLSKLETYKVTRIVDGHTFWVEDGSEKGMKIRLLCVDAPDLRASSYKEKGPYSEEASEILEELIVNKFIKLEYDVQRYDQYRRVLAYAYLENGTFVNGELIRNGYAKVVTYQPNVKHVDLLVELQKEAQRKKRRVWK